MERDLLTTYTLRLGGKDVPVCPAHLFDDPNECFGKWIEDVVVPWLRNHSDKISKNRLIAALLPANTLPSRKDPNRPQPYEGVSLYDYFTFRHSLKVAKEIESVPTTVVDMRTPAEIALFDSLVHEEDDEE